MYIALFTNHSKPTSIGPNHSHCLANYSNSVMIGYLEKRDRMEDIPDSIGATLEQIDKDAYVNIYTML